MFIIINKTASPELFGGSLQFFSWTYLLFVFGIDTVKIVKELCYVLRNKTKIITRVHPAPNQSIQETNYYRNYSQP